MRIRLLLSLAVALTVGVQADAQAGPCLNISQNDQIDSGICINKIIADYGIPSDGGVMSITLNINWFWVNTNEGNGPDFYQLRFNHTTTGGSEYFVKQFKLIEFGNPNTGFFAWTEPYVPGVEGPPYYIQIQQCTNPGFLGSASCATFANATYTPPPPYTGPLCGTGFIVTACPVTVPPVGKLNQGNTPASSGVKPVPGGVHFPSGSGSATPPFHASEPAKASPPMACKAAFVWRQANAQDQVCVAAQTRSQVAAENQSAKQRQDAKGGCLQGYVWREANTQDHVCVVPQSRAQAAADNAASPSRTY
jgi:hypothetical protein